MMVAISASIEEAALVKMAKGETLMRSFCSKVCPDQVSLFYDNPCLTKNVHPLEGATLQCVLFDHQSSLY